ncbi:hypothetical protein [Rhizobium sp. 21-4511-3d]
MNKHHVRWATPLENSQDKYGHGTMHLGEYSWKAKLTADQVLEIRGLAADGVAHRLIAERYGISATHVQKISARKKWRWLTDERERLRGIAALQAKLQRENDRIERESDNG